MEILYPLSFQEARTSVKIIWLAHFTVLDPVINMMSDLKHFQMKGYKIGFTLDNYKTNTILYADWKPHIRYVPDFFPRDRQYTYIIYFTGLHFQYWYPESCSSYCMDFHMSQNSCTAEKLTIVKHRNLDGSWQIITIVIKYT